MRMAGASLLVLGGALWHSPEDPVMGSFSSWFYSFQRHLFTVARIGRTFIKDNKEVLLC
jgi:hypothetical protein